jgi:hypothetical protein
VGEDVLLGFPVGVQMQEHQYQLRGRAEEAGIVAYWTAGPLDEGQERVTRGQRSVKVKGGYIPFHVIHHD